MIGQVYFNLHKKVWSIKAKEGKSWKVGNNHHQTILARPLKFHVGESGRQRVLSQKQKNVHAWVLCEIIEVDGERPNKLGDTMSYNPYHAGYYYKRDAQLSPIIPHDYELIFFDAETRYFYEVLE